MSANDNSFPSGLRTWLRYRFVPSWWRWAGAVLIALAVVGPVTSAVVTGETSKHGRVSGAGKTIIEGGTGGTAPVPVTTLVAFHADTQGGDFEFLALAPSRAMYVTGKVTSVDADSQHASLRGTATVTGIGAGQNVPFTARVTAGGSGATVTLSVSGLTFREILVEGHITID